VQPIDVLPFDEEAAGRLGGVATALARRGERIGTYGTLTAAHDLACGLTLATGNTKHFRRVAGLKLANWVGASSWPRGPTCGEGRRPSR
jgi:tRNA(fMet)-specific endonuclease VapC